MMCTTAKGDGKGKTRLGGGGGLGREEEKTERTISMCFVLVNGAHTWLTSLSQAVFSLS